MSEGKPYGKASPRLSKPKEQVLAHRERELAMDLFYTFGQRVSLLRGLDAYSWLNALFELSAAPIMGIWQGYGAP